MSFTSFVTNLRANSSVDARADDPTADVHDDGKQCTVAPLTSEGSDNLLSLAPSRDEPGGPDVARSRNAETHPASSTPPVAPPSPAPARRLDALGVYQIDLKGGTRVLTESQVVGTSRPADGVIQTFKRGDQVLVSHELQRGGHYAVLVTRFEGTAADMKVTQRLYRWDAQAKAMVDVTQHASLDGQLAVDWNMPAASPTSTPMPTVCGMLAELIAKQMPPALVIPYVKDSILVEHFEFTPSGEPSIQHWNDSIGRRWEATGERKTSFWYSKLITVAGAAGAAAAEVNAAGKGIQGAGKGIHDAAKITEEAKAAKEAAKAAAARAETPVVGPYGSVTRGELEKLANSNGPTVTVKTSLTQAPAANRALSTTYGEGAEGLAKAAQPAGDIYTAQVPKALIKRLEDAGLAVESTTSMANSAAKEIRFLPGASEFIVRFFRRG